MSTELNLLKPTGYVMHQHFNIQLYILPTMCLCFYLRTNSDLYHSYHRLIGFYNRKESVYCAVRTSSLNKAVCASSLKG
jgi:hypothetical protein